MSQQNIPCALSEFVKNGSTRFKFMKNNTQDLAVFALKLIRPVTHSFLHFLLLFHKLITVQSCRRLIYAWSFTYISLIIFSAKMLSKRNALIASDA